MITAYAVTRCLLGCRHFTGRLSFAECESIHGDNAASGVAACRTTAWQRHGPSSQSALLPVCRTSQIASGTIRR